MGSGYIGEHSYPVTVGDGEHVHQLLQELLERSDDTATTSAWIRTATYASRTGCRGSRPGSWQGIEGQFGLYPDRIIQASAFSDTLILSSAFWVSSAETIALQNEGTQKEKKGKPRPHHDLLPLAQLLQGAPRVETRSLWNSEASLLVRWGLYRSGNRQGFLGFAPRRPPREPATWSSCSRNTWAWASTRSPEAAAGLPALRRLRPGPRAKFSKPRRTRGLNIREARSVDVARIIGDWGRALRGRSAGFGNIDYQRECLDQADRLFEEDPPKE